MPLSQHETEIYNGYKILNFAEFLWLCLIRPLLMCTSQGHEPSGHCWCVTGQGHEPSDLCWCVTSQGHEPFWAFMFCHGRTFLNTSTKKCCYLNKISEGHTQWAGGPHAAVGPLIRNCCPHRPPPAVQRYCEGHQDSTTKLDSSGYSRWRSRDLSGADSWEGDMNAGVMQSEDCDDACKRGHLYALCISWR
jgi:hypothetical protein